MLPRLVVLTDAAATSPAPALRFQSELLAQAIRDFARTVSREVGGDADRDLGDVLARYVRDHGATVPAA
jgi:hypothetical protein